jgi:hypothetical protein
VLKSEKKNNSHKRRAEKKIDGRRQLAVRHTIRASWHPIKVAFDATIASVRVFSNAKKVNTDLPLYQLLFRLLQSISSRY